MLDDLLTDEKDGLDVDEEFTIKLLNDIETEAIY